MAKIKAQFTLRLDPLVHAKIKKIAEEDNRSLSNMIDSLIKEKIKDYEDKNGEVWVTDYDIYGENK